MNTKLIHQCSSQLPYIPYICLAKIVSHLKINDLCNLMETCHQLKDRIENEILPNINSICLCFSHKCPTYPKHGLAIFHVLPPFHDMEFIWKYDSIQKLLSKRCHEVAIIINLVFMNEILIVQDFFKTCYIDGKILTIRMTSGYEMCDSTFKTFPTRPYSTEEFYPLLGLQTFESIEQLKLDLIDLASTDTDQIISTSMNEIVHFPLKSFCLNIQEFSQIIRIEFERLCNLKSECKFQLGFIKFSLGDDWRNLNHFTNSSNITEIDLIQYENRSDWRNVFVSDWRRRRSLWMDIYRLEKIVRYAPNVNTLKTSIGSVSPNDWSRLFSQMSSLTKLEIVWWYDDKVWRPLLKDKAIHCSTLYNVQHLTLVFSNESHGRAITLLRSIKFPSLQTLTLKSTYPLFIRCNQCNQTFSSTYVCVRGIYVELAKYATNLKSFFAFDGEYLGKLQRKD
ncbi:hypothetical protein RDWZM_010373 [Blomia tropicalis]|uniref:F-box domain-containing protein n=1 Tax=Blomia tropicalis TaxID=40697 RepID=A0A9Q0RHM6_BLOTA|nr:hypothetical protein RDWZM_010373 [Blomia tropicalis]